MRMFFRFLFAVLLLQSIALGQGEQLVFQRSGFASVMPVYQRWTASDTSTFSQTAMTLSVSVPLGRSWSASLRTIAAGVSGDVASLKGAGDTQIGLSYNLTEYNIILNASANLPSGKEKLTSGEFETSVLISKHVFDLYVPNFGQGAGVTLGGIWGIQLSEKLVLGLGASYAYLGAYTPLEQYDDKYDPGEEFLISGGMEYRASKSLDLSCDIIFTTYGRDKLEDEEIFGAGNKFVVNAQLTKHFDEDELWIFLLYRSRAKSQYAVGESFVTEANQFMPNQFELRSHYEHRFTPTLTGRALVSGELSSETADRYSGARIFGLGLAADIVLDGAITIAPVTKYSFGTLKDDVKVDGLMGGVGISWSF